MQYQLLLFSETVLYTNSEIIFLDKIAKNISRYSLLHELQRYVSRNK